MGGLVQQGMELAALGMGTVFLFLSLLIGATMAMSRIILATEGAGATLDHTPDPVDPRELAAVTAAVHQFRAEHEHT